MMAASVSPNHRLLERFELFVERQYRIWQHRLLQMPRTPSGGVVTAEDIVLIVLLVFAIAAPPAFLWLGVILERRKTRRQ
jgi:hypothetical protein